MRAKIERQVFRDKQTTGTLTLFDDQDKKVFSCKTLELPWLDNQKMISCIPEGSYNVSVRKSAKYGNHFHIENVENRTYILIHAGNYHTEIKGCILVGDKLADIDADSYKDVTNSVATIKKLLQHAPAGFCLDVAKKQKAKKDEV